MKARKLSKLVMAVVAGLMMTAEAQTQEAAGQAAATQELATLIPKRTIVVSLEDHKLALLEDGQVKKVYTVAVGKPSTPSPVGTFTIQRRVANPVYHHNGKTIQPGPHNPVGTRWMGLSVHGYGIHGTNEPRSIGKSASHGCIRLAQADLEELYGLVAVGDTVELVGQRNQVTAQLFGDAAAPLAPANPQPTVVAAAGPESMPAANAINADKTAAAAQTVATAAVAAELR